MDTWMDDHLWSVLHTGFKHCFQWEHSASLYSYIYIFFNVNFAFAMEKWNCGIIIRTESHCESVKWAKIKVSKDIPLRKRHKTTTCHISALFYTTKTHRIPLMAFFSYQNDLHTLRDLVYPLNCVRSLAPTCNYSAFQTHFNSFSFFSLISSRRARRTRASSSSFSPSRNFSLLLATAWASRSRTCSRTPSACCRTCCWCRSSFSFSRLMSSCWTLKWQKKRLRKISSLCPSQTQTHF